VGEAEAEVVSIRNPEKWKGNRISASANAGEEGNLHLDGRPHQGRDQRSGVGHLHTEGEGEAEPRTGQQQIGDTTEKGDDLFAPVLLAFGQSDSGFLGTQQDDEETDVGNQANNSLWMQLAWSARSLGCFLGVSQLSGGRRKDAPLQGSSWVACAGPRQQADSRP